MILLGNRFLDVYNTLFDSSDNLRDYEHFRTTSSTSSYLVTEAVRLLTDYRIADGSYDIIFHRAEKMKTDPPNRYEISKWSFVDATPIHCLLLIRATIEIPYSLMTRMNDELYTFSNCF